MKSENKSISNDSIHFIQLKLFDFMDGKPNFDETLNKRLNQYSSLSNDYSLELDENNTFKYINPECPKCGSHKIIKKGTITKNKQNILGKSVEFKEQQYQCKSCNKKFGIKNKALFDDNKYFFKQISDKIPEIMKKGYNSLRKIKAYFKIFLNIDVSHTTIKNWLKIDENILIINEKSKYSGYYLYDEQFLRLNGKRHYRLTIYDSVYEIPISEKIVRNRSPSVIKRFIKELLHNKPIISITTDLYPMYRNIMDDLNIKQQLCIIHLRRTIYAKLKRYKIRTKLTEEELEKIYDNSYEFIQIFHETNYYLAKQKYEEYINKYEEIPEVLQQFMEKHVINFIDRYLLYLKDPHIEKTSNKIDNYYRNTDPEIIKKQYKTRNGILSYLYYQMVDWTDKKEKDGLSL